jgi:hypothetical protein
VVTGALWRITVLYSDGMDARIDADGYVYRTRDMSTEDLLEIVEAVTSMAEG